MDLFARMDLLVKPNSNKMHFNYLYQLVHVALKSMIFHLYYSLEQINSNLELSY